MGVPIEDLAAMWVSHAVAKTPGRTGDAYDMLARKLGKQDVGRLARRALNWAYAAGLDRALESRLEARVKAADAALAAKVGRELTRDEKHDVFGSVLEHLHED